MGSRAAHRISHIHSGSDLIPGRQLVVNIGPFHVSEILGGVVAVLVVSVIVTPTPVVLGIFAFLIGQVVVRAFRKSRR